MTEKPIELANLPDDVEITEVFHHVTPPLVAQTPELRRRLIEFYREERKKFVEENTKGKKVAKGEAKSTEDLLESKLG